MYRWSYYDVFNELNDSDKLAFIKSLLDKQFLDIDPENLEGMVKFAWISQVNSIEQQIKGYKSKTKDSMQGGCQGGSVRGEITPSLQEEEKEKEEEKGEYTLSDKEKFLNWFNERRTFYLKQPSHCNTFSHNDRLNLIELKRDYSTEQFEKAIQSFCNDKFYLDKNLILPNQFLQPDKFVKFLNAYQGKSKSLKEILKNSQH